MSLRCSFIILALIPLSVVAQDYSNGQRSRVSDDYSVLNFDVSGLEVLPDDLQGIEQLNLPSNVNYKSDVSYNRAIRVFIKVFAEHKDFSTAVFSHSLINEARQYDIDPCFVVSLMASSVNLVDPLAGSLVSLFGQDETGASAIAPLLQLDYRGAEDLDSEYFVAHYFVRYIALLQELLGGSGALTALAWRLGFDELTQRLNTDVPSHFNWRDMDSLRVVKEAHGLCLSSLAPERSPANEGEPEVRTGIDRQTPVNDN